MQVIYNGGKPTYLDDNGQEMSYEDYMKRAGATTAESMFGGAGEEIPGVSASAPPPASGGYAPARRSYSNPGGGSDPVAQNNADRNFAYDTGTDLMDEYGTQAAKNEQGFGDAESEATQRADQDIDQGGVSGDQINRLEGNESMLNDVIPGSEEMDSFGYSAQRQGELMGNPDAGREYFQPEAENTVFDAGANARRGAITKAGDAIKASYDPASLRVSKGYSKGVGDAIGEYGSSISAATDRSNLALDPNFKKDYLLSQEDQQAMATKAGRDAGLRYAAESDELERKAAAAGVNPLGVAAAKGRMNREAAISGADATADARLAASKEASDRVRTAEGMRLDAEGRLSGLKLQGAGQYAQARLQASNDLEDRRVRGEESVADKGIDAAKYTGDREFQNETALAQEQLGNFKDQSQRGYDQARAAEQTGNDRLKYVSQADVDANRYRYQTKAGAIQGAYDRKQATDNRIVDQQQQNRSAGMQYKYSRPGMYSGRQTTYDQMRGDAFKATTQAGQNATQAGLDYKAKQDQIRASKQSIWSKLAGAAIGVAGNLAAGGMLGGASKAVGAVARGAKGAWG